jgi:HK97 gp10 family phage protein
LSIRGVITIEHNGDELAEEFRQLGIEISTQAEKGMQKIGNIIATQAKLLAPVKTGRLRRSIASRVEREGDDIKVVIGTNLEYAPFVEYGTGIFTTHPDGGRQTAWRYQNAEGQWFTTVGQKPQPFLMPAFHAKQSQIERIFEQVLREL